MKFSVNSTLSAIAKSEIDALVDIGLEKLRSAVTELVVAFVREVTPCRTRDLEHQLHDTLFAFAKGLLEQLLNSLETTPDALPKSVTHCEKSYRRLEEATPREVVTRFGKITLIRCRYRRGRSGRTIFPLEIALGLQQGFTPAAASIWQPPAARKDVRSSSSKITCALPLARLDFVNSDVTWLPRWNRSANPVNSIN
jgi:hypothetical protein